MKLIVNEIFYSLQGEGARTGEASIFIRLSKCNLACSFCDTDFETGNEMPLDEIHEHIQQYSCQWIIWTGGEPTLHLKDEHLRHFKSLGYKQAIETNGTNKVSELIDYISCSPKKDIEKTKDIIPFAHEIRIPVTVNDDIPEISTLPKADNYFLSPVFDGEKISNDNLNYCLQIIKQNPIWKLSIQIHKLIYIQ